MAYNSVHSITRKTQAHKLTRPSGTDIKQRGTSYDWSYAYSGAGKPRPHAPLTIGNRDFLYDFNGNQLGWRHKKNGTRRDIVWDEENRMQETRDQGHTTSYKYDEKGDRVIKRGRQGETVYVNQFYTVRNRALATKHVFAGSARIASKLLGGIGNTRVVDDSGAGEAAPLPGRAQGRGGDLPPGLEKKEGLPPGLEKKDDQPPGQRRGRSGADLPGRGREQRSDRAGERAQDVYKNPNITGDLPGRGRERRSERAKERARDTEKNPHLRGGGTGGGGTKPQEFFYFFHPDHLGNTSYVTDVNGDIYEHVQYFAFGETWVEQASNKERTPYLFSSKELDESTGLYYFGARYYDPRTSVWISPDPALAKILPFGDRRSEGDLPGGGGVFKSRNLGLYSFAGNSPLVLIDADGLILQIRGDQNFVNKTFAAIRKIAPTAQLDRETGIVTVRTGGNAGQPTGKEIGTELVTRLVESDQTVTVVENKPGTRARRILGRRGSAAAADRNDVENGTPTDALIIFDPSDDPLIPIVQPDGTVKKQTGTPKSIVLGHEMIHALHDTTGTAESGTGRNTFTGPAGKRLIESVPADDIPTIGLGSNAGRITENALRREAGLPERGAYGGRTELDK